MIDLPAPKGAPQEVIDLPGLPGQNKGPAAQEELIDLPAPKRPVPQVRPPVERPKAPGPAAQEEIIDLPAPLVTPPMSTSATPTPLVTPLVDLPQSPAAPPAGGAPGGISLKDFDSSPGNTGEEVHLNAPAKGIQAPAPSPVVLDIVDLPAPKQQGIVDLPAPKRKTESARPKLTPETLFPNEETLDLVTLQPPPSSTTAAPDTPQEIVDLPAPKQQGIVDLPMPKQQDIVDLPMPKQQGIVDLPMPKQQGIVDLPMPKRPSTTVPVIPPLSAPSAQDPVPPPPQGIIESSRAKAASGCRIPCRSR